LGRGVAQINKRRLLGPELTPKQEHGLHAFFSYAEPPQTTSSASHFVHPRPLGAPQQPVRFHTAVAAESALTKGASSESMSPMATMKGAAILKSRTSP
jgi:hypothetical protein